MEHQHFLIMGACNLKCKYCFYETGGLNYAATRIKPYDLENWLKTYTKEHTLKSLTFTGGEPLLRKDILDFLKIARQYTEDVGIITNGTMITEPIAQFFLEQDIEVHVSLDSLTSDYHERTRGLMKDTLRGLDVLKRYSVKRKSITCVLSSENIDQVGDIMNYADKNEFAVNFSPIAADNEDKLSLCNSPNKEKENLMKQLKVWAKQNDKEYYLGLVSFVLNGVKIPRLSACTFTNNSIVVDSDGSIYPCYQHKDNKIYKFGNIKDFNLDEVKEMRQSYFDLVKPASCIKNGCLGVF